MSGNKFTLRTENIFTNKLLQRKQMVVSITHPNVSTISKKEIQEKIATLYKVKNPKTIVLFGFKTAFGGGRTNGFCLVYDSEKAAMDYEPKFRLKRVIFSSHTIIYHHHRFYIQIYLPFS